MAMSEEQIQEGFTLVFSNVTLVSLGENEKALMPDDGQLRSYITSDTGHGFVVLYGGGIDAAEAKEMEYESIDGLVWQSILLLEESLEEKVGSATTFAVLGSFLGGNVAESLDGGGGVENRNGNSGEDGRDDVCLTDGAGAAADEREEETLEKGRGLVETLFQTVEKVDVELLGLVNVFADLFEDDHFEESLDDMRLGRDEDAGGLVCGVGCPFLGLCDVDDVFPMGDRGKNLEGLG